MSKNLFTFVVLALLLLFCNSSQNSIAGSKQKSPDAQSGTLEKMIVASGSVVMDIDLNRLDGVNFATAKAETLRFAVDADSFFTVLVFNNVLRGPEQGSIALTPQNSATLPAALSASLNRLVVEKLPSGEAFDLAVRDGKTGLIFFNIEGHQYDYDANAQLLSIKDGRLLISQEFAQSLGRPLWSRFGGWKNFYWNEHATGRDRNGGQWHPAVGDHAASAECRSTGCPALSWNGPRP